MQCVFCIVISPQVSTHHHLLNSSVEYMCYSRNTCMLQVATGAPQQLSLGIAWYSLKMSEPEHILSKNLAQEL